MPGADGPDLARAPQLLERPPAGVGEVAEVTIHGRLVEVPAIQVVDVGDVEPGDAEPEPALLDGSHDPVVRVVERDVVARAAEPRAAIEVVGHRRLGASDRPSSRRRTRRADGRAARRPSAARTGRGRTTARCRSSGCRHPRRRRSWPGRRVSDTRTKSSPIDAPPKPSSVTSTAVRPSRAARGSLPPRLRLPGLTPRRDRRLQRLFDPAELAGHVGSLVARERAGPGRPPSRADRRRSRPPRPPIRGTARPRVPSPRPGRGCRAHMSVFTSPGWMTFAVTPVPGDLGARCRVSWLSATLAVRVGAVERARAGGATRPR